MRTTRIRKVLGEMVNIQRFIKVLGKRASIFQMILTRRSEIRANQLMKANVMRSREILNNRRLFSTKVSLRYVPGEFQITT